MTVEEKINHKINVLGHNKQVDLILKAFENNSISQANIFYGPPYIGKFSFALWFSQIIFCSSINEKPCGICKGCRKVAKGINPDLTIISPSGQSIQVDQVRDLQQDCYNAPFEFSKKVFIIKDAHKMTDFAANCFLKILEEPPETAIIILIADTIRNLPPTVISRCRTLRFIHLSFEEIKGHLLKDFNIPESSAKEIAVICAGKIEIAQGLAGKMIADIDNKTVSANIENIIKIMEARKEILKELSSFHLFTHADILRLGELLEKNSTILSDIFVIFINWFRDILTAKKGADDLCYNKDKLETIRKLTNAYTLIGLFKIIEILKNAKNVKERNVKPAILIYDTLFKMKQAI